MLRPTSTPPKAKVWKVAGPVVVSVSALIVTSIGSLTHHVSDNFLEKIIEWVLIATIASSTPRGVLDAIRAVIERDE